VKPATKARIGEVLAEKYRIVRFMGEGGMGAVYEAQHEVVGRRFAVKFLHTDLARRQDILDRFKREARAAGELESENIASVIDFGQTQDGIPYLVMELLQGEDLAHLLAREGKLPVVRAVNLVIQACRGIEAAHAAGIIHRDLKPENLFVCRRGDGSDLVKILDFGIAKLAGTALDVVAASVTNPGATLGTPFYMPPEQARGENAIDHRADIYGLGVILFEALSGQKPHPGDSYNVILYHILTQPAVPLASLRPGLPDGLAELVHLALSPDPNARPASAKELAHALSRHAGREALRAGSQLNLRVTRSSASRREPSPQASEPSTSPTVAIARRRRWRWLALLAVITVAGAAAALLVRPREGVHPRGEAPLAPVAAPKPAEPAARAPAGADLANEAAGASSVTGAVPSLPKPPAPSATPAAHNLGPNHGNRPSPANRQRARAPMFDTRNPYR
jgi:serine/threonine protein kinase